VLAGADRPVHRLGHLSLTRPVGSTDCVHRRAEQRPDLRHCGGGGGHSRRRYRSG
jgi:hypothetical protein